jgi:glyoxylase-like metal-dependent hydrolase (beta-lactamase superfamily II)
LVDTGRHAAHVAAIEQGLKERRGPLVAIVNTHWHLDHVSGNLALKAAHPGVRVYASDAIDGALTGFLADSGKSARAYLATGKASAGQRAEIEADLATVDRGAALKPDVVIARSAELRLAGRRLRVELARHAATAGDVWLYDPATRVAVAGDLVTLPAPFLDTACPEGWRQALDRVAATPFVTLVPGHGAPMDRTRFETWRKAFGGFIDCAGGTESPATCADRWVTGVASLIAPADARAARGMVAYYVGLLRGGSPALYCTA